MLIPLEVLCISVPLLAHVTYALSQLLRYCLNNGQLMNNMRARCRDFISACIERIKRGSAIGAPLVTQYRNTKRVSDARSMTRSVSWVMAVASASILCRSAMQLERTHSTWADILWAVSYTIVVIVRAVPQLLNERTLDALYSGMMAVLAVYGLVGANTRSGLLVQNSYSMLLCFAASTFSSQFSLVVVWNALYSAAIMYRYASLEACVSCGEMVTPVFSQMQVLCFILIVALIVQFEATEVSAAQCKIEARVKTTEHSAVNSLLNIMCDAVIELDRNLIMTKHVPALSNMLLHGTGMSLQGSQLQQFMASDNDRRRFEESMRRNQGSNVAWQDASVFHSKFRDSMSTCISMELFRVSFLGLDEDVHHLIGLREHTDVPRDIMDSSNSECSVISNALIASSPNKNMVDGVQINFEAAHPCRVTWMSPSFKNLYGHIQLETRLIELLPDGLAFMEWLTPRVDAVLSGTRTSFSEDFGFVALKPSCEPRLLSIAFSDPAPFADRRNYQVSMRVGKRKRGWSKPGTSLEDSNVRNDYLRLLEQAVVSDRAGRWCTSESGASAGSRGSHSNDGGSIASGNTPRAHARMAL